ncbi:substrate-binding domain-containing protein [Bradyrhizobium sp. HKCCYLS1011]|uniref:substrate-binding domain-containing protein n=1 Tax=Bradyrhizobium sp. HKCCYLS1011 TaxID=3420733 RepID=UPI003EB7AD75
MKTRSSCVTAALAVGGLIASITCGQAAQVKVFASVALKSVLDQLSPAYEKDTGNKLLITCEVAADLMKRISDGEAVDVVILTRGMINDLQKQNRVVTGSAVTLATTEVSVVTRSGMPMPNIGSVEALRQALLGAKAVAYSDPAKGGLSGVVSEQAIERMGIAKQMSGKTVLVAGGQAAKAVAAGDADIGIAQASEIVPVAGVQMIGPLPGNLASVTVFAGAIGLESASAENAKGLIEFLRGPEAALTFKGNGFEPQQETR